MKTIYKCPVCQSSLFKEEKLYQCSLHHTYDISKYGYANFLLANQIHSSFPGDRPEMILARKRFLSQNYYAILRKKLVEIIKMNLKDYTIFCDLACGEGYYTNYIHQNISKDFSFVTYGIDLSKRAIIEASKTAKQLKLENINYCIGNLMFLPYLNTSFDIMLNCFAPMIDKEFCRVLKENGIYIRVLPGKNHLLELKSVLYEKVILNQLKDLDIPNFSFIDKIEIEDKIKLESQERIHDLFMMTPYYYKTSKEAIKNLYALNELETTISFIILIYKKGGK